MAIPGLVINYDIDEISTSSMPYFLFKTHMMQSEYKYFQNSYRTSLTKGDDVLKLFEGFEVQATALDGTEDPSYFLTREDSAIWYSYDSNKNTHNLYIIGPQDLVSAMFADFRELTPPIEARVANEIPVKFWSYTQMGPKAVTRFIDIHPWEDIYENYPGRVGDKMSELFQLSRPGESGKLILWHGPPGTGKTHAIRSLGHHWRDWTSTEYVVDPDVFFSSANYLTSCLLQENENEYAYSQNKKQNKNKWRLLIVEDAGEFITSDAKRSQGQAMARLLNVADGLLGQGLRIIVLITTNEPFQALDKAVSRPGRCLAEIGFEEFNRSDAQQWLKNQGVKHPELPGRRGQDAWTLAELYHIMGATEHVKKEQPEVRAAGQYL